jgi:hypothetical protein
MPELLQCGRGKQGSEGLSQLTPTRNRPSFTPDAAEGGTRVRLTRLWSCVHVRVPWIIVGARTQRRYCKAVGANSTISP